MKMIGFTFYMLLYKNETHWNGFVGFTWNPTDTEVFHFGKHQSSLKQGLSQKLNDSLCDSPSTSKKTLALSPFQMGVDANIVQ